MILAVESSCDDSAIALWDIARRKIVFADRIGQNSFHTQYGGVVPELAARLHAENLPKLLERALPYFDRLKAVAVTNEPGLTVSLAEGVVMAQALVLALGLPLLAIHHIKGHIFSLFIDREAVLPLSALMVSGGHTMLVEAASYTACREVASTLDDSIGEAFDKVAKMLGLGYPGGAVIESLAANGDENRFDFPVPLRGDQRLAFSFSGLKNSVRLAVESCGANGVISDQTRADLAASFQKSAVKHLLDKARNYLSQQHFSRHFGLVGGVSQNQYLRKRFSALCAEFGVEPLFAPLEYCSDNAAMIARCAAEAYALGAFVSPECITITSRSPLKGEN